MEQHERRTEPLFELVAEYAPAGDQPQAIEKLAEGLNEGLAHQTLLGVTGSGKSVGYSDRILVADVTSGEFRVRLVKAGPFIDDLMRSRGLGAGQGGDTEKLTVSGSAYLTFAYNPASGETAWHPIAALLRHRAPDELFCVTTKCGRSINVTSDHNFWVLRDGQPTLVRTQEIRPEDCLPVPDVLTTVPRGLGRLDSLPYFADTDLVVHAEGPVLEYLAVAGNATFISTIRNCGINPYRKLSALRCGVRGSGIRVRHFLRLLSATARLGDRHEDERVTVGGKKASCRLPAVLRLTESTLALLGYYIAEGNAQERYIVISNHHPLIRRRIEAALNKLGLPFTIRPSSDYQISSLALRTLLTKLCGRRAAEKHLPEFWLRLSDSDLGSLLRAYFDGDGTVGYGGEVIATTASRDLADDLAYALKRFGIHARLRNAVKRATNTNHAGGLYFAVVVSGHADLRRYAEHIGFDHPEKQARLNRCLQRKEDTNVDVVPVRPDALRRLRIDLGLSMKALAALSGCSRPMLSLIEGGHRRPSRGLLKRILRALECRCRAGTVTDWSWWIRWKELNALCQVRWTPIARVERAVYPHEHVYDLSVPGPETFIAGWGGTFVHNTYSIANVIQRVQRPAMVLAHNKTLAAQLYGEFR